MMNQCTQIRTKIGSWNVGTLFQKGKLVQLNREMDRHKLDILGISEVRWTGSGQVIIIIIGARALTNLGRLSSPRWQSFPTAPDGTGFTCGQHIESHSCIFSFPNQTVTSLFK
jgi:hypothetical protein